MSPSFQRFRPQLRPGHIQLYQACDTISGGLILTSVVFSPWAFGTTQTWSIWTMNTAGFVLGVLLMLKLALRVALQCQPPRWDDQITRAVGSEPLRQYRIFTRSLALLTLLLLAFCLISAVNARATFRRSELSFEYHDFVSWLPHSLDSGPTWHWFWILLALALYFWAVRDWILGKTEAEIRNSRENIHRSAFSDRLRLLLWVLAINGAVLAVEGIVQRIEGSGRLLFLVKPRVNPGAVAQFGPFAYRANAASYFNLLWPVCVGFWWTLQRHSSRPRTAHHVLLGCAAVMAACPIISTSRGGAVISVTMMAITLLLMLVLMFTSGHRKQPLARRGVLLLVALLFCGAAIGLGYWLGWKEMAPRISGLALREGFTIREEMNIHARPMARDYPWFGTGPGTFESVFQLYRKSTDTYWPAQVHNDWLETRITFGRVGSALIAAGLLLIFGKWFAPGGLHGHRRFVFLVWLAMAGCLAHARYDFPFQIYSILLLFLTVSAAVFSSSRRV